MQIKCSKCPCQIILYRGAFLKCIWMLKVLTEINAFPLSSLLLNESHDVSSCSQLLVFVIHYSCDIKDELLFCSALETITKADDVMENVSNEDL